MRSAGISVVALLVVAACSGAETQPDRSARPTDEPSQEAPPAPTGATAPAPVETAPAQDPSFPVALRGSWRETSGDAPTATECAGSADGNIGKVLAVRAASFSIFENGGRLLWVKARSPGMIRAIFDTTYADTPTRGDLTFSVDPVAGTLTLVDHDEGGQRTYRRCPR